MERCLEYTVEAGRPDTMSSGKLGVIYDHRAPRISINPQSMEDRVLQLCGRRHTAEQMVRAFGRAREAGFREINMDLIAGLPGDSPEGFAGSLAGVAALAPSNITVHTLAIKKGADLLAKRGEVFTAEEERRWWILPGSRDLPVGIGLSPLLFVSAEIYVRQL